MNRPLNLMFVIKTLAYPGGAERVISMISGELAERGHAVTVATLDSKQSKDFYPLSARVRRLHLCVARSDSRTGPLALARQIFALRRVLQVHRPAVAIGAMNSSYVPLAFAGAGLGIPVIANEHIEFGHYHDRPLERQLIRGSATFVTRFSAISPAVKETFPAVVRRKMDILRDPVTIPVRAIRPHKEQAGDLIVSVGRLEAQKDHATLLSAFARVANDFPAWTLEIYGEGNFTHDLTRQIRELGVVGRAKLCGVTANIDAVYRRAKIFALSSRYESFGLVTAEAMSHAVPAVGFADCPGTNELIVDGENGVLVDPSDRVGNFAEALRKLMDSADLRARLGAKGPATARQFSLPVVADEWEAYLTEVANG